MSKTYTSQEFEIEFYAAMVNWASVGKVGPDPRGEWEFYYEGCWTNHGTNFPNFCCHRAYRWKQPKKRTVPIGGVELVAPEIEEPASGTVYYAEDWTGTIFPKSWVGHYLVEDSALANGKVFLTREDCQAMADAQREQRLGEVK